MAEFDDPIYPSVLAFAKAHGKTSVSQLQESFRIGYNRACRLIERMVGEKHFEWSDASWKSAQAAGEKP